MLSGGIKFGYIGLPAAKNNYEILNYKTNKLKNIFKDRFYLEIQRIGLPEEDNFEKNLFDLAKNLKIMLVATNNCNFLNQAMYESQKVLHCIANSELLMNYNYSEISINNYLKSSDEMINLFHDIPEAIDNTIIIAKRCSFLLEKRSPIFPKIGIKNEFNELEKLSKNGLEKRISQLNNINNKLKLEDYNDRLNAELSIIGKMGFSGYFLIVYDFIKWSKDKNIRVGPGRGSEQITGSVGIRYHRY